ncbi:Transcriptional activator somA [Fusarium oxysporum f. sp. albedinis]|nr:Transcriptional activator somA [Fusarium oxysporum f. sp. albedinis]
MSTRITCGTGSHGAPRACPVQLYLSALRGTCVSQKYWGTGDEVPSERLFPDHADKSSISIIGTSSSRKVDFSKSPYPQKYAFILMHSLTVIPCRP